MQNRIELLENIKNDILLLGERHLNELMAIGIFGSILQESFNERSDIDIFIVVDDKTYEEGMISTGAVRKLHYKWYSLLSEIIYNKYRRGTTVLIYPYSGIKNVASWKTISLASDSLLVYDKDGLISSMFKRICEKAIEAGLERVKAIKQYIWRIRPEYVKPGKIIKISLENE